MPFKSEAQRRYMYANHPELAREFEAETPKGAKLPEKVKEAGAAACLALYFPKVAASRLDKEIAAGRVSPDEVAARMGQDAPAFSRHTDPRIQLRQALAAPAPVPPEVLARRRVLNQKLFAAQAHPDVRPKEVANVVRAPHPGMGIAYVPATATAHVPENAGRMFRAVAHPLGQLRYVGNFLAQQTSLGNNAFLPPPSPVDATLARAVQAHEFGEALASKDVRKMMAAEGNPWNTTKTMYPHASHLGTDPLILENLAAQGDPEAQTILQKIRMVDPDDAHVQRLMRRVGATPGAPIPLEGRQHRALNRLLAKSGKNIQDSARQQAATLVALGLDVGTVPQDVRDDIREVGTSFLLGERNPGGAAEKFLAQPAGKHTTVPRKTGPAADLKKALSEAPSRAKDIAREGLLRMPLPRGLRNLVK